MPTAIEQTYIEIGRLYVESLSFAERVHEYLEILEFAEFSDVVDFAASSGKARKKPNCTPGKSQLCGGACVSIKKQCKKNATGAEKTAGGFIADHVQAKKGRGAKVAGSAKPKTSGAAEAGMNLTKTVAKVRAEAEKKAKPVEPAVTPAKAKKADDAPPKAEAPNTDTTAASTVKDTPESIRAHYQRRSDEMGTGLSAELLISVPKDGKGHKDGTLTYTPEEVINSGRQRIPVQFIAGKSDAPEKQINKIAEYLKANGRNIVPVFVRKTGEDAYEVVHNGQILDAARKNKQDFIRAVEVDDVMERQLKAELARNKSAQGLEDDGSPVAARKIKDESGIDAKLTEGDFEFGSTYREPTQFISGKSDADSKQIDEIASYLKETRSNIMPVLVRKTGENKFEAVYNNQILDGARKAGLDFVQTIKVDNKAMERQVMAELGLSGTKSAASTAKAKKAEDVQPDSKAKLFDDVKALELQADVLKKNPASGGIIDRLTVVTDSLKRNALREDLKSGAVSMGVISQLAGGANDRNPALASASDRVVAEAYKQIPTSTKNRLATKRGEFLVEADFPAGSETAKVQADLRARRDRIRSGAQ